MPKVFVINDMNHSFRKAEKYGELRYVTTGKVPIFKTSVARSMLRQGLRDFDYKKDYLLISGPALLCIMATLLVVEGEEPIMTLVFDAKEQDYVVRHISA